MGWSGTKLLWGDEPQDYIDGIITDRWGINAREESLEQRREYFQTLATNKPLREHINHIYQDAWDRKATDAEYKNLIQIGLGLPGGVTVQFKVKKASSRKKKSSRDSEGLPSAGMFKII